MVDGAEEKFLKIGYSVTLAKGFPLSGFLDFLVLTCGPVRCICARDAMARNSTPLAKFASGRADAAEGVAGANSLLADNSAAGNDADEKHIVHVYKYAPPDT